jgi:hypothetical protein
MKITVFLLFPTIPLKLLQKPICKNIDENQEDPSEMSNRMSDMFHQSNQDGQYETPTNDARNYSYKYQYDSNANNLGNTLHDRMDALDKNHHEYTDNDEQSEGDEVSNFFSL